MNTFRYHRWRERIGGEPSPEDGWPARRWSLRRWTDQRKAGRERDPLAAMYWRRRLVALTVGLAVLAVIAWAFNGAIGGVAAPGGSTAAGSGSGSGSGRSGSGSGGSGPGSGGSGSGGSGSGAGQQQELGGGSGTSPSASASPQVTPSACPHGDVVLSLINAQPTYGHGQLPQFTVDVVATGSPTCTFNVGASHIALVIRSGAERVWSSGDCVQGAGDLVTDLQRGVPTVLPISWNRQPSAPGCRAQSGSVPDGIYTATAADGWLRSNTVTFRIG
jgi:hypothetical protein